MPRSARAGRLAAGAVPVVIVLSLCLVPTRGADAPGSRMATAGGVTTANIMPGSANVIGGQTLYVKLRGRTVEAMRITGLLPDGTVILGGLKMANGENPKGYGRTRQQAPFTRMK